MNVIFPGPSAVCASVTRSIVLNPAVALTDRVWRGGVPRDDTEERVSSEFFPYSNFDSDIRGTMSPGEGSPFFVVALWFERPPSAKKTCTFRADGTRRMKREAWRGMYCYPRDS